MAENKKIVVVNLQKLEVAPIGADGAEGTVFEEVPVAREDTFIYEDEDPEVKDYKDVAGNTYYSSKKPGAVKINASIGMYDLDTKAKFQGVNLQQVQMVSRVHGNVLTMWRIRSLPFVPQQRTV